MPLVALLDLGHLGIAQAAVVLGGTRGGDQRGIDNRAALHEQPLGRQRHGSQHLQAQVMGIEQVAAPKNGALIG